MDSALFEIVPNISEGRDPRTIDRAVEAVVATGARVIDRTSDAIHHRSVLTILGNGKQCVAAALALAEVVCEAIDLRVHRGVHPRIGALDVLPFVPLRHATLDDAAELARRSAEAIWQRFTIPSFYYGHAATGEHRRLLADVRRGEFEGLETRFADPAWRPDVGNVARHERSGAIAVGARPVLVAFNVVLDTGDLRIAKAIAKRLRERDGGLTTLRALGLALDDRRVQVSLNVTDPVAVPLYRVVALIERLARLHGVGTLGSELIGCLPRAVVETAARYYLGVMPS